MGDSHANRVQCESFSRSLCVLSRRVPLAGANLRNLWVSARKHHDMMMLPVAQHQVRHTQCSAGATVTLVYLWVLYTFLQLFIKLKNDHWYTFG